MMQEDPTGPEVCHFCGLQCGEAGAERKVCLRSRDGTRQQTVSIPRCGGCLARQRRSRRFGLIGSAVALTCGAAGLVVGIAVFGWHPVHHPVAGYGPLRIGVAIAIVATILAVGGYLVGGLLARIGSGGQLGEDRSAESFGPLAELLEQGWLIR